MSYAGRGMKVGMAFAKSTPIGGVASKLMSSFGGLTSMFGPSRKTQKLREVRRAIMKGNLTKLQRMSQKSKFARVRGLATGAVAYAGQASGAALLAKAREFRKTSWQAYKGEQGSQKATAMPGGAMLKRVTRRKATVRRKTTTKRKPTKRRTTTTRKYSRMPAALARYWKNRRAGRR